MIRTRWAAIGAAVAVSIGAGGVGLLHATVPNEAAAFVPITPCRLFDTRPEFQVGPRSAPLGPNETFTADAIGDQGECIGEGALPTGARGVVLNVTAVGATQATYVALFPADAERPNASSLNPTPGQAPTPNAVTTDLSDAGEFAVYNRFGQVHVLADIVGYYTDHHHDDRYYTKDQTTGLLAEREPVTLHGEAPEFEATTVHEANGLRIQIRCGLAPGSVQLVVGPAEGGTVRGHGTWFAKQYLETVNGWVVDEVTHPAYLGSGSLNFNVSGTVMHSSGDGGSQITSVEANVSKEFGCPYRIHLTPIGVEPLPAP